MENNIFLRVGDYRIIENAQVVNGKIKKFYYVE